MTGRVKGKVALITGAARGQGRNHAVRLAEEGASIIAVDFCEHIDEVPYPLATPEDLAETARLVQAAGGRITTAIADVRSRDQLLAALAAGLAEFGQLDIVVANAGVSPVGLDLPPHTYFETVNVNLVGVLNTVSVAMPHLRTGASIIAIGSIAAFRPDATDKAGPGGLGYSFSKKAVARLVTDLALLYGPQFIRVNAVHPTCVNTPMMHNDAMYRIFVPHSDSPTREQAIESMHTLQVMPLPYIEPDDVSNAVVYLASDESRYVTGSQFNVDAGALLREHG
jgi:SDR family mycofactocin-dependent oxidoreductase